MKSAYRRTLGKLDMAAPPVAQERILRCSGQPHALILSLVRQWSGRLNGARCLASDGVGGGKAHLFRGLHLGHAAFVHHELHNAETEAADALADDLFPRFML